MNPATRLKRLLGTAVFGPRTTAAKITILAMTTSFFS